MGSTLQINLFYAMAWLIAKEEPFRKWYWMSNKKQELVNLYEHVGLLLFIFCGSPCCSSV